MKAAQFNLRQMLVAVAVCAVACAVAAPFLRRFPLERVLWMCVTLAAGACTFGLSLLRFASKRQRFEASAGRPLLQVGRWSRFARFAASSFAGCTIFMNAGFALMASGWFFGAVFPVMMAASFGMHWSQGLYHMWWHTLELCEHGIIVGERGYFPWDEVKSYVWGRVPSRPNLRLAFSNQSAYLKIPVAKRNEVDSLLAAKIPQSLR